MTRPRSATSSLPVGGFAAEALANGSQTPSELEAIPLAYMKDCLAFMGPQLLECVDRVTGVLNGIPPDDSHSISTNPFLPTHILAIFGPKINDHDLSGNMNGPQTIILQPTHHFILTSQCNNPPELSEEASFSPFHPTFSAVPLHLPHPHLFEHLHRYLYNHAVDELLQSLLPVEHRTGSSKTNVEEGTNQFPDTFHSFKLSCTSLIRVASLLAERCSENILLIYLAHLLAFKENVVALGVCDQDVRAAMSTASFVLRSAFSLQKKSKSQL